MKKQVKRIASIMMLLASFLMACQSDIVNFATPSVNAALTSKNVKNLTMTNTENSLSADGKGILINSNQLNKRGLAGPGFWGVGVVRFNNCNQPNGLCRYMEVFGGGEKPTWEAKLIGDGKIRLEYVVEVVAEDILLIMEDIRNGDICTSDPSVVMDEAFAKNLSDFIQNNFNVPKDIPFETEVNNRLIKSADLPSETQLVIKAGEYKIIRDDEHPKGYFDLTISYQ